MEAWLSTRVAECSRGKAEEREGGRSERVRGGGGVKGGETLEGERKRATELAVGQRGGFLARIH